MALKQALTTSNAFKMIWGPSSASCRETMAICAAWRSRKRTQIDAVALKLREDANAVALKGDIISAQVTGIREVNTDISNVFCIGAADSVDQ